MEGVIDFTEPQPLDQFEAVEYEDPWLWRVELYLSSKYVPEFVESSVFKMRTAALARHRVVIESHKVLQGIEGLDLVLSKDLTGIPMVPQNSPHKRVYKQGPDIGGGYQKNIDEEFPGFGG